MPISIGNMPLRYRPRMLLPHSPRPTPAATAWSIAIALTAAAEVLLIPGRWSKCPAQNDAPCVGSGSAIRPVPTAFRLLVAVVNPRCPSAFINRGARYMPEKNMKPP